MLHFFLLEYYKILSNKPAAKAGFFMFADLVNLPAPFLFCPKNCGNFLCEYALFENLLPQFGANLIYYTKWGNFAG